VGGICHIAASLSNPAGFITLDEYLYNFLQEYSSTSLKSNISLKKCTLNPDIPDSLHNMLLKKQRKYLFLVPHFISFAHNIGNLIS
jgi:hypothetical protein